jgi:hypothetical protein
MLNCLLSFDDAMLPSIHPYIAASLTTGLDLHAALRHSLAHGVSDGRYNSPGPGMGGVPRPIYRIARGPLLSTLCGWVVLLAPPLGTPSPCDSSFLPPPSTRARHGTAEPLISCGGPAWCTTTFRHRSTLLRSSNRCQTGVAGLMSSMGRRPR